MSVGWISILVIAALLIIAIWLWWWPGFQRRRIMQQPFPTQWAKLLQANLPIYQRLDDEKRRRWQQLIQYFLFKKQFVGCAGLVITDEIRVTIAAEACLLILHQPSTLYQKLRFIYIYPHAYQAPHQQVGAAGVITESIQGRLGESWGNGKVVLSWDDVTKGTRDYTDGENVVLHEFAHQLDQESGVANGAPLLRDRAAYQRWARVLADEYRELKRNARYRQRSLVKHYGATNPAEFFAVVTEHFFEQPQALHKRHPELFQEMQKYYGIDPRQWS